MSAHEAPVHVVRALVATALAEDLGPLGDLTAALVPPSARVVASMVARDSGVLAGRACAIETFRQVEPAIEVDWVRADGDRVANGDHLAVVAGPLAAVLTAERTALNFLMRLSGVATLTRAYVNAIAGTGATILDTRKTTPGLRILEKYAVLCGGGQNHRLALWDMYLVKDNHIRAARGLTNAIDRIQRTRRDLLLEVEVESLDQLQEALRPEVDRILIDNQTPAVVKRCVEEVDRWYAVNPPDHPRVRDGARRWPEVEVSGGLNLKSIRGYAETGVDYLSVGALTHSAPALDLSLEIEEVG